MNEIITPIRERKVMERAFFAAMHDIPFREVAAAIPQLMEQPERELHYVTMAWLQSRKAEYTPATGSLIETLITTKSW